MRRDRREGDSTPGGPPAGLAVRDTLLGGKLPLWQPVRGYRTNVDALLLAGFAADRRPRARHLVDLGAGVGAVALAYGLLGSAARVSLVEREPALAAILDRNIVESGTPGAVLVHDVALPLPAALRGAADVVVSNPPFFPAGTRASKDALTRAARAGALAPFLDAARSAMGRRAYAFFVYPAPALPEFLATATKSGLVAKRLRLVHPFANAPARLALLELRQARPGGLVVEGPLVEWAREGVRSPELEALVSGERARSAGAQGVSRRS